MHMQTQNQVAVKLQLTAKPLSRVLHLTLKCYAVKFIVSHQNNKWA